MDNRLLILLGLLMAQRQHGYQINEFIETNLGMITDMKKPTAYATLEKLSKQGYIEVQMEQEGNRPPRKVYSINENGKKYFYELLLNNLSSAETIHYTGDIGLMFLDHLPIDRTIAALKDRLAESHQLLEFLHQTPSHSASRGVNLAIQHKIKMLEAEIDFIANTMEELA